MQMETDFKRNKESSRPAWAVPRMNEPETKRKTEGQARKREGKKPNKTSKGHEGLGLADSEKLEKPYSGQVFD